MKWTVRGIKLIVSPLLLVVFALSALLGFSREISFAMAALLVHELGHLWAARAVNEPVASLELLPFGAVIKLCDQPKTAGRAFLIAVAGPAISLVAATVAAGFVYFFPQTGLILDEFVTASLLLAAVNLLPAAPLDGGRMTRALLCHAIGEKTAKTICFVLGIALAAGLLALGIRGAVQGSILPVPFCMALFLVIGGLAELRRDKMPSVAVLARRSTLNSDESIRLYTVAIHSSVKARDALKRLRGASLVAVMDGSMHLLGTLSEGDLLRALIRCGSDVSLGEIVRHRD